MHYDREHEQVQTSPKRSNVGDLFRLCPQLSGGMLFAPPDARALFLRSDLLCNCTCSETGGGDNVMGGTNGKDPNLVYISLVFAFYSVRILLISLPFSAGLISKTTTLYDFFSEKSFVLTDGFL